MLTKPENIKFESTNDIIDYVGLNLPPTKTNYDKVVDKILHPDSDEVEHCKDKVVLNNHLFSNIDTETFVDTLDRVYDNRIKNRNNSLIAVGVGLALFGLATLFRGKK